jgi:hypothetical protein
MRPRFFLLSLPLLALTATACGSSSGPSASGGAATATPAASADAICAVANTKINAIPAPSGDPTTITDASQLAPFATYLDQLTPFAVQEQTDLAASSDGASLTTTFSAVITAVHTIDAAAHGTDVAAFTTAAGQLSTANIAFHAAATAANLPNCAK